MSVNIMEVEPRLLECVFHDGGKKGGKDAVNIRWNRWFIDNYEELTPSEDLYASAPLRSYLSASVSCPPVNTRRPSAAISPL